MRLNISTLAERPDLAEAMWAMDSSWPEFMRHDPIGGLFYSNVEDRFADYVLCGQDDAGEIVAQAHSIPFVLGEEELPLNGWDGVIRTGVLTAFDGGTPDAISAIEIAIRPDHQGRASRHRCSCAMRDNAARHGFAELVAPVRPSGKEDVHEPMATYAFRTRDDGLPVDPWLRVHVRAGGVIDTVAQRSMCIPGTLDEWRAWTGLPFDTSGLVEVPRALVPVQVNIEQGIATYVEPNVWVRHRTGR